MERDVSEKPASQRSDSPDPQIEPCPVCRRPLPVRSAKLGEAAAHWECAACRSPVTGILVIETAPSLADRIRIAQAHFDTRNAPAVPDTLRTLIKEFSQRRQRNTSGDERRSMVRVPQHLDVAIVAVDECWTPRGKPIPGIVVDLTAQGIGLVTTTAIEASHVALQFRHTTGLVQLLGRVAWSKCFGEGYHNAGVQFVLRFGRPKDSREAGG